MGVFRNVHWAHTIGHRPSAKIAKLVKHSTAVGKMAFDNVCIGGANNSFEEDVLGKSMGVQHGRILSSRD